MPISDHFNSIVQSVTFYFDIWDVSEQYTLKKFEKEFVNMDNTENLHERVKELQRQLAEFQEKDAETKRKRVEQMSSEVVDTNPYRYLFFQFNFYLNVTILMKKEILARIGTHTFCVLCIGVKYWQ